MFDCFYGDITVLFSFIILEIGRKINHYSFLDIELLTREGSVREIQLP